MNKIIEVALAGKFTADAVQNVMEVIMATPNPEMATEILLGIYEEPKLLSRVIDTRGKEKTLVEVDYWNSRVKYSYVDEVVKSFYAHKDTDPKLFTIENYQDFRMDSNNDDSKWFNFNTGEFTTRNDSCTVSEWMMYKESHSLDAV